ncbi:hypothetical protein Aduo_015955 [Ancylostoma duodenale]
MQDYQDAMSIVSKYGKPDLFVTFTCNPKWRETKENLKPGQAASGRPDLIAREFRLKQEEMFEDLFRRHVLGEMAAWIAVYEWQRRGLLRVHILSTDRQTEDGGRGGQERIAGTGRNIRHVVPPPELPPPQLNEVSFDPVDCAHKGALLYAILNTRQLHVYDTILAAITDSSRSRLFFIDGPGGSGKTYLYNSIFNMLMGQR